MTKEERAAFDRARAVELEDDAIRIAETRQNVQDWPRKVTARCAHAELKLSVAALLRGRAANP